MYVLDISDNDIIQADATVIAGALVFLTVSSIGTIEVSSPTAKFLISYMIAGIILPFAFSAHFVSLGRRMVGLTLMQIGFAILILVIITILILSHPSVHLK